MYFNLGKIVILIKRGLYEEALTLTPQNLASGRTSGCKRNNMKNRYKIRYIDIDNMHNRDCTEKKRKFI